jgi:glucans biosynthesis protein
MKGRSRCRIHGGAAGSGGQLGNRSAYKHGRRSQKAVQAGKDAMRILRIARAAIRLGLTCCPDREPKPTRFRRCQL